MCAKVQVVVNDLKKEFGSDINISNISVSAAGSAEAIAENKLGSHGAVVKDADGKVLATNPGHAFGKTELMVGINKLIKP